MMTFVLSNISGAEKKEWNNKNTATRINEDKKKTRNDDKEEDNNTCAGAV